MTCSEAVWFFVAYGGYNDTIWCLLPCNSRCDIHIFIVWLLLWLLLDAVWSPCGFYLEWYGLLVDSAWSSMVSLWLLLGLLGVVLELYVRQDYTLLD